MQELDTPFQLLTLQQNSCVRRWRGTSKYIPTSRASQEQSHKLPADLPIRCPNKGDVRGCYSLLASKLDSLHGSRIHTAEEHAGVRKALLLTCSLPEASACSGFGA